KSIYALVGDEPFLQILALKSLLAALPKDTNRVTLDGETAELGDVFDELRSFSMFGGGKLVVLRDADGFITRFRDQMEDYAANPVDSSILVLRCKSLPSTHRIAKLIAKVGTVIKCEPPKQSELAAWIIRHAREAHQLAVPADAAAQLADLIGVDLGKLDTELGTLALIAENGKITADAIRTTVAFQREQEMRALTEKVSEGNIIDTLKLWRQLLQTDPATEFRASTWLTIWVERLTRVRLKHAQKIPAFVIARDLRIWPASQTDSLIRMAQRLGEPGIRAAVTRLADADMRSKSGLGDFAANIEGFLLSLR
ncbi:MAG TPA: DNA polymerase III subunit delta, partial [Tepidisphaeraceae bacterium]|nr:DNA polymerase III subunit delta [Tepidisphaeraceae bacterium]